MMRKQNGIFLGLIAVLAVLAGVSLMAYNRWNQTDEGGGSPEQSPAIDRNRLNSPAGKRPPLHQARLDAAGRRQLEHDPAGILSEHATGDGDGWTNADNDLLVAWAARDPGAAMRWVDSGDHSVLRSQLLGAVAAGLLVRDGREAMEAFLAEHQDDPLLRPKDQGTLLRRAFFHLGRADTIDAALEILRGSDDSNLAGSMVLGTSGAQEQIAAIDYLEAKGHPVEVDYWSFQASIGNDPRYWADWAEQRDSEMLPEIMQAWARASTAEARTWVEERFPPENPRYSQCMEWVREYER